MSKIICDVCGTSYPESGTQCPICGCVRPADVNTFLYEGNDTEQRPTGTYTYVKGGRFSKANVKKRNQGKEVASIEPAKKPSDTEKRSAKKTENASQNKNDVWFVATIVALLVAIVAVVIYIALRYFAPGVDTNNTLPVDTTPSTTEQTQETTSLPDEILCEEITLSKSTISFDRIGTAIFLNVSLNPADTTEDVSFVSDDESVATVDSYGRITAVGTGKTTITVYCGSEQATCQIVCDFGDAETTPETTEATTDTIPDETTGSDEFDLSALKLNWAFDLVDDPNVGDVTLTKRAEEWVAYTYSEGKIPTQEIVFSSSDTSVVTIDENGVVTAVGEGEAMITAEYQGHKVKCRILCVF